MAGCLYALAYPSEFGVGWLPFVFIALPIFLWQLQKANFKESLAVILFYNLGLNLVGYYWIPATLREFGQLPFLVSLLLGSLFTLILQPHWWPYLILKKYFPKLSSQTEVHVLITALIMTLLERFFPQQFPSFVGSPWLHLTPYLSLAPWFGVVIFSFITFWVSLEAVAQLKQKKFRPQVWIVFILFILLNALFPLKNPESQKALAVRVVQPNVGNFLKLASESGDVDSYNKINELYHSLSTRNNDFKPDLIIWPETAHPTTFYGENTELESVFLKIMEETGSELLIGGYEMDPSKSPGDFIESVFNSSILLSDMRLKSSYHKNILIPFGETLPFGPLNRSIVSVVPAISLFAQGIGTPLMETRDGYRFITPICYELLESNYMRSLLNQWGENHFIVNHTNDSWYGKTAEPFQHLFLSKWRALEFQLPIIRSTNTGVSSVIYPNGSESKQLLIGEQTILDIKIPMIKKPPTVYQKWGELPFLIIFAALFLLTFFREKIGSRP